MEHLAEAEKWLDENLDAYREAINKMKDPEFVKAVFNQFSTWLSDVQMYKPHEHPSDVAVAIVSRLQVQSAGFLGDIGFVNKYEDEKKMYDEARRQSVGTAGGTNG